MKQQSEYHSDVLIVGGGTASLFLSECLLSHKRQPTVRILERAAADQRRTQGVLVHPITQILIETIMPEHSWDWSGIVQRLREFQGDALLHDLDAGTSGPDGQPRYPSNVLLTDLDRVLLNRLEHHSQGQIEYQVEVTSIDFVDNTWHIDVTTHDGPQHYTASVLIAADGRGSTLRDQLGISYERVAFPGAVDVFAFTDRRNDIPAVSMVRGTNGITTVIDNGVGPNTVILDMRADHSEPHPPQSLREEAVRRVATTGLSINDPTQAFFAISLRSSTITCETWLSEQALVFGDAAHAVHNIGGQGFNLTIQNAIALTPGILELIDGDDSRIRAYEAFRLPYITELQHKQNQLFNSLAGGCPNHDNEGWYQPMHRRLIEGQEGLGDFVN